VRNEEVLHGVKEKRNILHTIKRMKANWTGHILHRNCLQTRFIVGNRMKKSQEYKEKIYKQLLDELKEILGTERGSTRLQSVENLLRKGLQTHRKTDYRMNAAEL
jgi:metal-responsive CopG/Arc/MetJ family transcriptional regulator